MKWVYIFTKKYPAIITLTIIFNRLPVTNPINEPRAALNACLAFFPAYFSHRYDPINGPAISPTRPNGPIVIPSRGNMITEIINPILLPLTPRFVQPNFLVHRDGTT